MNHILRYWEKLIALTLVCCLCCLKLITAAATTTTTTTALTSYDIFYFEIFENSQPNTFVGKIATKPGFTYRFNDEPPQFELDFKTGVIVTTNVPTDRETKSFYNLVILSSSPTYPLEVKIKILDVNDNVPHWPSYINTNLSFSESAPIGTKIIIETAIDLDENYLNYQINYNDVYNLNNNLPFKLNYNISSSFLHLEVSDKLDRETQSSYVLNISAIDSDLKSSSILFYVKILDSNDNPPIFDHSDYSVSLNESIGKDVSILQVRATDADEEGNDNSKINYYLLSDEYFTIDPNTGIIFTAQDGAINCGTLIADSNADYSKVCVFTVFANDRGTPRQDGRTYVTAKIFDSNNHAPTIKFRYFSRSEHASVDENAANGSIIAAVSVVDLDHGINGETTLKIADGDPYNHFRLDSIGNSHIIRVNGSLDRERVGSYNVTIVAFDHGFPTRTSSAHLIIVVYDHNDHSPKFSKDLYETSITESQQTGVSVSSIRATDLDEGINSNLFYSLSGANSHYFKIDQSTGLVTTDKVINREEIDLFELRITARDGGSNPKWAHTILKVKVSDVNDEIPYIQFPKFVKFNNKTQTFELEVEENKALNISLTPIDSDLGSNGTVDLFILYDYNGVFEIEKGSNRLISKRSLDYEQCDSYKLSIIAKDRGLHNNELSSLTSVLITVRDSDDILPILYPKIYFAFIPFNFKSLNYSIVVSRVLVRDYDSQSSINFVIHSHDSELVPQMFSLNSRTGEIKLKTQTQTQTNFNKYVPNRVKFNVGCQRCRQQYNDSQVFVYIINSEIMLERESIKKEYHFSVKENQPIHTTVGTIDIDLKKYRLYLVSGDPFEHFMLTQNTIKTKKSLDREMDANYKLQIVAANNQYFFHIDVNINVIDVNDCHPLFNEKYVQISVPEDSPPKLTVYKLQAFDADIILNEVQLPRYDKSNTSFIEYKLISNPYNLFYIHNNELKLIHSIDRTSAIYSRKPDPIKIEIIAIDNDVKSVQFNKSRIITHTINRKSHNSRYLRNCELTNLLTIYVTIQSVNRYRPRFIKQFYEISISESTLVNKPFLKLEAIDDDSDPISYQIIEGNYNNTFGVFPDGSLYAKTHLDKESIDIFSLKVRTFEINSLSKNSDNFTISCQVLIHIIDFNDNKPQFLNNTFYFSIFENSPVNTLIGQIIAYDADSGPNSEIQYSIVKSYYSSLVEIDPHSGYIWSKVQIDRETLSAFEILVQATDQPIDEIKFSSQTSLRIEILDVNDNPPIFEVPINVSLRSKNNNELYLIGELLVSEDVKVESTLATFKALDMDSTAKIKYEIANSSFSDYFTLNDTTGVLVLKKQLDRELIEQFKLVIVADDSKFQTYFRLYIIVEDVNDCTPEWINFTNHEISIPEDIAIGSEIMKLSAIDRDIGVNGLFHFEISFSGNKKYFDILKQNIVVVNKLDYETDKSHQLNLTIIDEMGLKSNVKILKITVIDVNDCIPIFLQKTDSNVMRVSENIEIGSKLLTVEAYDCDNGDQLVYEINSCNAVINNRHYQTNKNSLHDKYGIELKHKHDPTNCPLKINHKNGEIININTLDRELIESIKLQITVKDNVGHIDKKNLIFIIDDINDEKPLFISSNKIVLQKEIKQENMFIGQIQAIDLDIGSNSVITYKLEHSGFSDFLSLNSHTGQLYTKKSFDYISSKQFSISVTATDGGGLSTSDNITFIILSNNISHIPIKNIEIDIYENEPFGTHITKLQCDQQFNLSLLAYCEFHITNSTDRTFAIDSYTGDIYSVSLIDREIRDKYFLEILIISKYGLAKNWVIINVLDQNDNPPYLKNSSVSVHIKESSPIDVKIFDLSNLIADEDTNNKFDYQIVNCSKCDAHFFLHKKSGILILKSELDRETSDFYRIVFGISDGIYLLTSILDIYIDDENDNKPYFNASSYTFNINENTSRGVVVGQIFAFDKDINTQHLTYSVISDHTQTNSVFSLDGRSGQITLTKHLDYEVDVKHYEIECEASDGTFKSDSVKVFFDLKNLDDNAPIFDHALYKIELYENTSNSVILCVSATDADNFNYGQQTENDSSFKLDYYFDSDSQSPQYVNENFEIDPKSGCISLKSELDREKKFYYEMVVIADDSTFKASTNIQIKVLDINDNFPYFDANTPKILRIEENSAIDTIVYVFKAFDLDEAPNNYIQYDILYKDQYESQTLPFSIGPIDGVLKITKLIDREVNDNFDIIIRAKDFGSKSKSVEIDVTIEIIDVIDNAPQFEQTLFHASIYENASINDVVVNLRATDFDKTDQIYYKILTGDLYGHFKVIDDSIVVAMKLDYQQIRNFDLKVNAIDKGGNYDTANVKITILNADNRPPSFINSPFSVNWCENEIGVIGVFDAHVHQINTNSANNTISYRLKNNYGNHFSLNSTNAELRVVQPIDHENLNGNSIIELRIIAIDSHSPPLTGECIVFVTIYDVNDNKPFFQQTDYQILLNENQLYYTNKEIGKVAAFDVDSSDQIKYLIVDDEIFTLDSNNGSIYLRKNFVFDRELRDRYELNIAASDSKFEVYSKVIININDINDCKPRIISVNNNTLKADQTKYDMIIPSAKLDFHNEKEIFLLGLKAFDNDMDGSKNSELRFYLNSSANNSFRIDMYTGIVKANQRITQQINPIELVITVWDLSEINPLSSSLYVNLKIMNDKHYKESDLIKSFPSKLLVSELIKQNETIFKFETMFDNIQLAVIGGDPTQHFSIHRNLLILDKGLDYERLKKYNLFFEAQRQTEEYREVQQFTIEIEVLNENDVPPQFDYQSYNASVAEEIDEPILVTQVIATDADTQHLNSQLIKYKIINANRTPFRIDEKSGHIWTTSKIDREMNSEFTLIIAAEDEGSLSTTCKVHVTIDDKNDNPPHFNGVFKANLTENIAIGTLVLQITSTDKDSAIYSQVTYSLVEPSESFDIDPHSGKVFVTGNIDREMREQYSLLVSANDGRWKAQTTLTIKILDQNDCTPKFEKQKYEFHKTLLPKNHTSYNSTHIRIGNVTAFDCDSGNNALVAYSFKHKSQYFYIDSQTGDIFIKKMPKLFYSLELRFLNRHSITVIAADKGYLPKSAEIMVYITLMPHKNSEKNQLKGNIIKIAIPYNLNNNTLLYTLSSHMNLVNSVKDIIFINFNKIIFKGESLVKAGEVYKHTLTSILDEIEIELFITDANLYAPYFVSNRKQVIVAENKQINQIIFESKAIDSDSDSFNNLVSYQLNVEKIVWNNNAMHYLLHLYENNSSLAHKDLTINQFVHNLNDIKYILNPFTINTTTGAIYLNNKLDFEIAVKYKLVITAYDNAWFVKNATFDFEVIVSDVNEHTIQIIGTKESDLVGTVNPDPMSIGVILVITFFLILILVISTSFLIFRNQKKNQMHESHSNQRKITNQGSVKHFMSSTASSQLSNMVQQQQQSSLQSQIPIHAIPPPLPRLSSKQQQPDVVSPTPVTAPPTVPRVPPAVPPSFANSHSDTYPDNYSNILATAEHYDLENASSIAPSDIDIVYHYKAFRNRDRLPTNQRHAPLSRLSPSVSELSSMPRILTLQDLSPQVPPCPPITNRTNKPKPTANSNEDNDSDDDDEEEDNNTDDSFTCSEFEENYDISKKEKSVIFQRVW